MAEFSTPHFHNSPGVPVVTIGVREFMCIGALPPLDHPHVFLDMGDEDEMVCPYCSTLYRFSAEISPGAAEPAACVWHAAPSHAA
jgi:uncharacterized Zn-finger protein